MPKLPDWVGRFGDVWARNRMVWPGLKRGFPGSEERLVGVDDTFGEKSSLAFAVLTRLFGSSLSDEEDVPGVLEEGLASLPGDLEIGLSSLGKPLTRFHFFYRSGILWYHRLLEPASSPILSCD